MKNFTEQSAVEIELDYFKQQMLKDTFYDLTQSGDFLGRIPKSIGKLHAAFIFTDSSDDSCSEISFLLKMVRNNEEIFYTDYERSKAYADDAAADALSTEQNNRIKG